MGESCTSFRAEALRNPSESGASGADATHALECGACRAWLARAARIQSALLGLERLAAPAELDRRVEGEDLGRVPLDRALAGLGRVQAPSVLERLVAEELANPAAARARRFAGGLPRLSAPEGILEGALDEGRLPWVDPISTRRSALRWAISGVGLAAAALLVLLSLREGPSSPSSASRGDYRFRVVRSQSLEDLDPMARALVDGLDGGLLGATAKREGGV